MNKKIEENMMKTYTSSPWYDLDDIIEKEPKLLNILAIFYSLNGILSIIEKEFFNFQHSVEKLRVDMREYYNYICDILAQMIYEYTYLACFGELRYMQSKIDQENVQILSKRFKNNTRDRITYVKYCFNAYNYSKSSIERVSEFLFKNFNWDDSFGGMAWYYIIKLIKLYGVMPNEIFIDHCVDIEHNTGSYLNKGCGIFSRNFEQVSSLLDDKRTQTPIYFINNYYDELDIKTIKFVERFISIINGVLNKKATDKRARDFLKSINFNEYEFRELNFKKPKGNYNKQSNFEIYKISLFHPHSFGEENMADFITVRIFSYKNDEEIIKDIPLKDFMINSDKYFEF